MTEERIPTGAVDMPVYVSVPEGDGPVAGVVIVHDALGMTSDLRNQAGWRARVS